VPNEKISWGKFDIDTPRFVIESDATIVAPLIFAYVLDDQLTPMNASASTEKTKTLAAGRS
jgi:deoxyhypusine synthase